MADLLLIGVTGAISALLLAYLLFGPDHRYVYHGVDRRRLTLELIGAELRERGRQLGNRENTWVQRHRLLTILAGAGLFSVPGLALFGPSLWALLVASAGAVVPLLWYRVPQRQAQMQRALPRLLANLASALLETGNVYPAFQQAIRDEPGPVFDHLRQALQGVRPNRSVFDVLAEVAEHYRYEPFTTMVRMLRAADRTGLDRAAVLRDFEARLLVDLEAAAERTMARKALLVLLIGAVGLLPAMLCATLAGPTISALQQFNQLPFFR